MFVERDAATIESSMLASIESQMGITLAVGDPRRALVSAIVALFVQERQNINITGRMNLLGYSSGEALIEVGKLVLGDTGDLLPASPSLSTVRFTLSSARDEVTTIPSGTLVAAGSFLFATTEAIEIAVGETTGDAPVAAVVAGSSGNGFVAGQINSIVEPIPYVASAANTTTSEGGAPQETEEAYRERVQAAPGSYSVAGPEEAYAFWAKSASAAIGDVSVSTDEESPGTVYVRPLLIGGGIPGADVLALVESAVTDSTRRPLTDLVEVIAPTEASYSIEFTYYVDAQNSGQALSIQAAVDAAVVEFQAWQMAKLGRDINPDKLRSLVVEAGAKRLTVTAPSYEVVSRDKVAKVSTVSVTYGGTEDA